MFTSLLSTLFRSSHRETADRYYVFSFGGFALFLHRLHHNEDKGVYHDHPWSGLSIILGRYLEQRHGERPKLRRGLHWVPARTHHRIELPYGPVWTIFFHFRRHNRWTVINDICEVLATEPWRGVGGITSYDPNKRSVK